MISAGERLRRLLAVIPWVVEQDGPTVDEIGARFDVSREQLLADLEVLWMIGLHPFTPDALAEVVIEDDRVWIRYADMFHRPLRLTPRQGLSLVAAGKALLAVPGTDTSGPLARALKKLADGLDVDPAAVDVDLGPVDDATLAALRDAVDRRRRCHLRYYSHNRDEATERQIEPARVWSDDGHWYVTGHCRTAAGVRVFRVDRIDDLEVLDEEFEPPVGTDRPVFEVTADQPRVTLEIEAAARWIADYYPVDEFTPISDGRYRAVVPVSGEAWLERLLLRLGPEARLVDPGPFPADLGVRTARRVLARYTTD